MRYFMDTEFNEYHKQPKVCGIKVGKPIPTIDLISIGIVSEDAEIPIGTVAGTTYVGKGQREYYAICKEFNVKDAWYANQGTKEEPNYWLRENVLKPIHLEMSTADGRTGYNSIKDFKRLLNKYGKTKKQIAEEIKQFCYYSYSEAQIEHANIEFYAYYADYDWVVFAQLFGNMSNLPKGFPMYCNDLKQTLDEKYLFSSHTPDCDPNYPKQENEHNALDDAKWNYQLHEFLNKL